MINQENTYLGADGLAYCKICGEPVEAFFPPDSILGMKKHFRQEFPVFLSTGSSSSL